MGLGWDVGESGGLGEGKRGWRKGGAGHVREGGRVIGKQRARTEVGEDSDATAKRGVLAPGGPRETEAGLKNNILDAAKNAALRGSVERARGAVVKQIKGNCGERGAIGLALAAGVAVGAESQGQFEFRGNTELVLKVEPEAIHGEGLRGTESEIARVSRVNAVRSQAGKSGNDRRIGRV